MYTLGVDIGSTASKAVILEEGTKIVRKAIAFMGTGTSGPARVMEEIFCDDKIQQSDIAKTVVTGYGRMSFQGADKQISELSCHARGVHFFFPTARTVIDIGGQDAKVLTIDNRGRLLNFVMNEKCAAGTGRFLDVMANVLEAKLADLGEISKQAESLVKISSICTVFAESEVISHLASGAKIADIVAGIHRSIAQRVGSLAFRIGIEDDVVMTGGVAQNSGVVKAMEDVIKKNVHVTEAPQFTGALGAAIYAFEEAGKINKKEVC